MKRDYYLKNVKAAFRTHSVVAILGPRQVGKSTLARDFAAKIKNQVHFFDLEDPTDLARLEAPKLALGALNGLIVIDEIQKRPDLFPVLRVLADNKKSRFLILGSASQELIRQSSESLAGRIAYIELRPFSIVEDVRIEENWIRGGYPRAYLAKKELDALLWIKNYTKTFLERDLSLLGFGYPPETMRKFWVMLTHYHGAIFNASEIGKSLGFSGPTMRRYLDVLHGTFMVRELQPWHENLSKRQIKSPKIYIRDTGILHTLMGLSQLSSIRTHPKLGLSWEGYALEQVIAHFELEDHEAFFWGTHSEAELDLLMVRDQQRIGFEMKYTDSPKITKSMRIALEDLKLDKLYILYPGKVNFKLEGNISVIALENLRTLKN